MVSDPSRLPAATLLLLLAIFIGNASLTLEAFQPLPILNIDFSFLLLPAVSRLDASQQALKLKTLVDGIKVRRGLPGAGLRADAQRNPLRAGRLLITDMPPVPHPGPPSHPPAQVNLPEAVAKLDVSFAAFVGQYSRKQAQYANNPALFA